VRFAVVSRREWFSLCEEAMHALFHLHPCPDAVVSQVVQQMFASLSAASTVEGGQGSVCGMARLLFVLGQTSLCTLVYTEFVAATAKKHPVKDAEAETKKAAPAKTGKKGAEPSASGACGHLLVMILLAPAMFFSCRRSWCDSAIFLNVESRLTSILMYNLLPAVFHRNMRLSLCLQHSRRRRAPWTLWRRRWAPPPLPTLTTSGYVAVLLLMLQLLSLIGCHQGYPLLSLVNYGWTLCICYLFLSNTLFR
jgi:hypothetical protein